MQQIYWLPLKANEFIVVDTTGFLKDFMVLKYLFLLVDFWRLIVNEMKILLKIQLEIETFVLKTSLFNGFKTFFSFFLNLLFLLIFM